MAIHQPMGAGGVDIEIGTGRPRVVKTREQRKAEAAVKQQAVVQEATLLIQELQKSPALAIIARQLKARILLLVRGDEQAQALNAIITAMRNTLEVAPRLADQEVRRCMGPTLTCLMDEAPQDEEVAAAP